MEYQRLPFSLGIRDIDQGWNKGVYDCPIVLAVKRKFKSKGIISKVYCCGNWIVIDEEKIPYPDKVMIWSAMQMQYIGKFHKYNKMEALKNLKPIEFTMRLPVRFKNVG